MNMLNMNSLLNLNNAMSNIKTMNSVDVKAQGEKSVLEFEIKQDKKCGVDTSAKEERVAEIEERGEAMKNAMMGIFEDVNEEANKAADSNETRDEADETKDAESKSGDNRHIYTSNAEDDDFELELHGTKLAEPNNSADMNVKPVNTKTAKKVDLSV